MLAMAWALALTASGSPDPARTALAAGLGRGERTFVVTFAAPELGGARDVDAAEARVGVRLPRDYATCRDAKATCWLLIYLPGFDSTAEQGLHLVSAALEAREAKGDSPPVVAVVLDGRTRLGGGWYVDAVASGRWESLVLGDVLPSARQTVLDAPASRTIVIGHSMGGFGALRLAERHPDAFSGVGALNPILRPEHLATFCLEHLAKPVLADGGVDAHAMAAPLADGSFCARIVATLAEAFASPHDSASPHALRWGGEGGWQLTPAMKSALDSEDLIQPDALTKVPRLVATTGARDPLSPPADVEALGQASGGGDFASVLTRVTQGDHTSHLDEDFAEALRYLTAPTASGGAAPK